MVLYAKFTLGPVFVRGQQIQLNSVDIHVVNEKGNSLNVDYYDSLTGKMFYSETTLINSDDFKYTSTPDLSKLGHDTVIRVVIYTTDSNGNTISILQLSAIAVGSINKIQFSNKVDIVHISLDGTTIYYRAYSVSLPDNNNIITMVYDPKEKMVAVYKGKNIAGMFKGTSAIVELRFRIPRNVASYYSAYIDDPEVVDAVYKVPELVPIIGAIAAIRKAVQGYPVRLVGISASYDDKYVYIEANAYIDLASPWSWWAIAKIIAGIACLVGAGIIAAGTAGVGVVVAGYLALGGAALIGAGVQELWDTSLRQQYNAQIIEKAKNIAEQSKQKIEVTIKNLNDYLDKLVSEGKLTQDEANAIKEYVENIKNEAFEAIDTLSNMVKKAYEQGYHDGYERAKKEYESKLRTYTTIAGVGGAIGGAVIGAYVRGK